MSIGNYSNVEFQKSKLYTFDNVPTISAVEKSILVGLLNKNTHSLPTLPTDGVLIEDLSGCQSHLMTSNSSSNSDIAMSVEFIPNTAVVSTASSFNLLQHNGGSAIADSSGNSLVTVGDSNVDQKFNNVSLGDDTAPLYLGNEKFEFSNGDSVYTSAGSYSHIMMLDASDTDYNIHKAVNSPLMNLDLNASNGFQGGFDNSFNSINAFYTEQLLVRDASNNQVSLSGNTLGLDGISSSNMADPSSPDYNALDVRVLEGEETSNHPLFGSLKFVQDALTLNMDSSNNVIGNNSTMSRLNTDTDVINTAQSEQTSDLPPSINESDFEALFTSDQLPKVGPGYSFALSIDVSGGYTLNDSANKDYAPTYDENNNLLSSSDPVDMFVLDDSYIAENYRYMFEMKDKQLFDKHKFFIKNGTFEKNTALNANLDRFTIMDGLEQLQVMTSNGYLDLTKSGKIQVFDTNNVLGHNYARSQKTETAGNDSIQRLVVNYDANINDTEYLSDVGVLSDPLQSNYYVESNVTVLAKSTITDHALWNSELDVSMNNNSCLVFQDVSLNLYSKANIINYSASGLNIENDQFALLQVNNLMNFTDSNESNMFKTSDNNDLNVSTNVTLSNVNLNTIGSEDLRVVIYGKSKTDLPDLSNNDWQWNIGDNSGNLVKTGSNIVDQNNEYLISEKTGCQYLGSEIYNIMKSDPNTVLNVNFKIHTNETSEPSKDVLERSATVTMTYGNTFVKSVKIEEDDNDFIMFPLTEVLPATVQMSLTGKKLSNNIGVPSNYEVKEHTIVKTYIACIKCKIGPFNNVWVTREVTEETIYYVLTNKTKNSVMPDFYLQQIVNNDNSQAFQASRKFVQSGTKVSYLDCNSIFKPKDLMGFTAGVQFYNGSQWVDFSLGADANYDYSFDPMYDKSTKLVLLKPGTSEIFGNMEISVDTPMFQKLGLSDHILQNDNPNNVMYMINMSQAVGEDSFELEGYKYSIASDSQYFNKNKTWSPYSVDALFLKDANNNLMGQQFSNLKTLVTLVDPTPGNTTDINEVNQVRVQGFSGDTQLFEFTSNKYILNNFNIILMRQPIIQHDYKVGINNNAEKLTEYLQCKDYSSVISGTSYVKLTYGANYNGVRCQLNNTALRLDGATFKLNSDRIYMSPLMSPVDSVNAYSGRYITAGGEQIGSSTTGFPLPTNSSIHRNIYPTRFRGYKNGQPDIELVRTMTTIKMVIGDNISGYKFQDDMNTHSVSNIGAVWKSRGEIGAYNKLEANDIRVVTAGQPQPDNLDVTMGDSSSSIGTLGLKIVPKFSMFTKAKSSIKYEIPIILTPAQYTKVIVNPLDASLNENVTSNVFDVKLHDYASYDIVASRIKVYQKELYGFAYSIPDIRIYHCSEYINWAPETMSWTQIQPSYTDSVLRDGVVVGDTSFAGVVKFKRSLKHVSAFTKYCLLPKPQAYLEAYNAATTPSNTLPANLSTYTREKYYFDINITDSDNVQGQAPALQQNKPFNKSPAVFVPNVVNAVPPSKGLNGNLKLGLDLATYLTTKYTELPTFDFTLKSNKLKIYNGIGLPASNNYTKIFDGYISDLADSDKWINELSTISNIFTDKLWNISTRQLLEVVSNFISLPPASLTDNYIFMNGISSFGLGTYCLNLYPGDSIRCTYYTLENSYDSINDSVELNFSKFTTGVGVASADFYQITDQKIYNFQPMIVDREFCTLNFNVGNSLTDEPVNLDASLNDLVNALSSSSINWTFDTSFVDVRSPVRLVCLSKLGAGALSDILQVGLTRCFKVFASTRPNLLEIKSIDGRAMLTITADGNINSQRLSTKQITLQPTINIQSGYTSGSYESFQV